MSIDTVSSLHGWVSGAAFADLPDGVRRASVWCLLDLVGTGAAGTATELSRIARDHAVAQFGPGEGARGARLLFDGRVASATGAALAGGMTIDSVDAHDGHPLTKGHAGAAVLPGLLALVDAGGLALDGRGVADALVVGYEVALRAGIALHATAPDYHTSGAWNALGVAAVANRLWSCDERHLREALGIAEYHGPRSQMMRCIDHPTMLKDGSGWGAMTGVSAAELARAGFTGAPAVTVEANEVAEIWADLGTRWRVLELYFKPYPVCRWAQPAIEAALQVRDGAAADDVDEIEVRTFHEATRLATRAGDDGGGAVQPPVPRRRCARPRPGRGRRRRRRRPLRPGRARAEPSRPSGRGSRAQRPLPGGASRSGLAAIPRRHHSCQRGPPGAGHAGESAHGCRALGEVPRAGRPDRSARAGAHSSRRFERCRRVIAPPRFSTASCARPLIAGQCRRA